MWCLSVDNVFAVCGFWVVLVVVTTAKDTFEEGADFFPDLLEEAADVVGFSGFYCGYGMEVLHVCFSMVF